MVIIKIMGGIASQISKYSFGYELAKKMNTDFAINISDYLEGYFWPLMLTWRSVIGNFVSPNFRKVNSPV